MDAVLAERRRVQLDEIKRETRVFARRADLPEDRIALAEIERELLELEKRWLAGGLLCAASQEMPLEGRRNGKRQPQEAGA